MSKTKRKPHFNPVEDYEDAPDAPKKWYEELVPDPNDFKPVTDQILIELKDEAKKCHDSESLNYSNKRSKTDSNFKWMKTIMHKGTVSDKIAAHIVAIQDNPVYNLETIRNLVGLVKVGKKKECTTVIETLTELFVSDLLKPRDKLKPFHKRPLSLLGELSSGNAVSRRKILSVWYFEDQLKEVYTAFVLALNAAAQDTVEFNKEKAISAMYHLLAGNSEQEQNLLKYIVNKLGDPSAKVASKATYCLSQLLLKHSNMQGVVLNEIERVLFRPNISTRAQYYALCFLSQFYLSHEASDVAKRLIEVYFAFFKVCVKSGDIDSRMMSALLMGINRAFPYAKVEMQKISTHVDTMYRLVHIANFNISLHVLTILLQVAELDKNINDRFYSALYKKLFDPKLLTTTLQAMLLSLVYKALLKDTEINRIKLFVKRLLQISLFTLPSFACGILYLISQLQGKKPQIQSLLLMKTSLDAADDDDDDGVETYHDVPEEPLDDIKPDLESISAGPSWYHSQNIKKEDKNAVKYKPLVRNPLFGGGEFSGYSELNYLKQHFHPTVALYAQNILEGKTVKYNGDPLKDFTLIRFLERFVFKNPKKLEEKPGVKTVFAKRKVYKPRGVKTVSVMSGGYLKEASGNIPVDELFLHTYLQKKYQDREEKDDESDLESIQSEEFEEMFEKMDDFAPFRMDEDIDFMGEIGDKLQSKNDRKKGATEEDASDDDLDEEESEFEDDDEGSELDDEMGLDDEDRELIADLDDDDEEDLEFSDEDAPKSKKKKKKDINSLFASADEFASLLEEEGSSKVKPGSSQVFANKDNAHAKQLDWEDKRNRWLQGYDKAVGKKGGKKRGFSGKNFGNNKKFRK